MMIITVKSAAAVRIMIRANGGANIAILLTAVLLMYAENADTAIPLQKIKRQQEWQL
jgi:hypothetical protein